MNLAPGFKSPDASKLEYTAYQKQLGGSEWMAGAGAGLAELFLSIPGADWNLELFADSI